MEEGFLNHAEQVPGLTNRPLVVHVHLQEEWEGGCCSNPMLAGDGAVWYTAFANLYVCTSCSLTYLNEISSPKCVEAKNI